MATVTRGVPNSTPGHGTLARYIRERGLGIRACDECLQAKREYNRAWRMAKAQREARTRDRAEIRMRALETLAGNHFEEFTTLFAEEKRKARETK